ncbi:unnamed protein product [marine sediment metagenome]|uniref:Uncharacterized protein n=1 Tax=marine sediment metagenome TaxID=412755 RepID=X1M2I5_9ZZZZ
MAKPKEQRNKLFLEDWQKGFGNEALGKKYKITEGGVKALKQRLRVRNPNLYIKPLTSKTVTQQHSKPTKQQASKLVKYDKVTYYLATGMAKEIKQLALHQDMDISELIREIITEYLKKGQSHR